MKKNIKIYFSAAIYGGRELLSDYIKIIEELKKYGEVLTEEVGDPKVFEKETNVSTETIYLEHKKKLEEADLIFAELTTPSLGVGYELAYAEAHNKKIVGIYNQTIKSKISSMISGNKNISIIGYKNLEEIIEKIESLI